MTSQISQFPKRTGSSSHYFQTLAKFSPSQKKEPKLVRTRAKNQLNEIDYRTGEKINLSIRRFPILRVVSPEEKVEQFKFRGGPGE